MKRAARRKLPAFEANFTSSRTLSVIERMDTSRALPECVRFRVVEFTKGRISYFDHVCGDAGRPTRDPDMCDLIRSYGLPNWHFDVRARDVLDRIVEHEAKSAFLVIDGGKK